MKDFDLISRLEKADHTTLQRIVDALDAAPVMKLKAAKEYINNSNDLTKIRDWIANKITAAGGYGIAGFKVSEPTYKEIITAICTVIKIPVPNTLRTEEIETIFLGWAFEEAIKMNPELPRWDNKTPPNHELVQYTRQYVVGGFKEPAFIDHFKKAVSEANDVLKNFLSVIVDYAKPVLLFVNHKAVKNALPAFALPIIATIATAAGEGLVAAAGALGLGGVAAAAVAYALLVGVYATLALAGPTSIALLQVLFELATLNRIDQT